MLNILLHGKVINPAYLKQIANIIAWEKPKMDDDIEVPIAALPIAALPKTFKAHKDTGNR
jgi:hypothetical protein